MSDKLTMTVGGLKEALDKLELNDDMEVYLQDDNEIIFNLEDIVINSANELIITFFNV